jgi:hypothetical protein
MRGKIELSLTDETVREAWALQCPKCKSDQHIMIEVSSWARLTPDGTDVQEGEHFWEPNSACRCAKCDHWATVADFSVDEAGEGQ